MTDEIAARLTGEEMARAIDFLIERVDDIEGSNVTLPEYETEIWLHTPEQVARWLRNMFCEVVNGD